MRLVRKASSSAECSMRNPYRRSGRSSCYGWFQKLKKDKKRKLYDDIFEGLERLSFLGTGYMYACSCIQERQMLKGKDEKVYQTGFQHGRTDFINNKEHLIWSISLLRLEGRMGIENVTLENFNNRHCCVRGGMSKRKMPSIIQNESHREKSSPLETDLSSVTIKTMER